MPGEAMMVTLSRPASASDPNSAPSATPGLSFAGCEGEHAWAMPSRQTSKHGNVDAHARCRNHSEIGERRITTADAGQTVEDAPELVLFGHLLHLRARIGDGDEAAPVAAGALEEILLEDVRFERRSRLAGDDKQRARQVDLRLRPRATAPGRWNRARAALGIRPACRRRARALPGRDWIRPSPAAGCA